MKVYTEIIFEKGSTSNELLLAALFEAGIEGVEEADEELKAFIPSDELNHEELNRISDQFGVKFITKIIQPVNWNEQWESGFEPVIVNNFAAIRASFHAPVENVLHEIIITPKMSFGTGHHATTYLMLEEVQQLEMKNKMVVDFGTGTGILAILAEKCGAASIIAIDNDDWSMENAAENSKNNSCTRIKLVKDEVPPATGSFDVILANINKNVILANLSLLKNLLAPGGMLLLSGLLAEDATEIEEACTLQGLHSLQKRVRNNWLCLRISN